MYIDYAGDKLEIVDAEKGEVHAVEVFVAILPCSHYTYCEAVWSQQKADLIRACKRGMRTYYTNAPKLLGALKVAKAKGTYETELRKIERSPLLILDDLFLVPLDPKERAILIDIIEDRHGRKSIIVTSQVPVANWYDAVGDPTVADAILDRIVHTVHQIELTGESVRKIAAKKMQIK